MITDTETDLKCLYPLVADELCPIADNDMFIVCPPTVVGEIDEDDYDEDDYDEEEDDYDFDDEDDDEDDDWEDEEEDDEDSEF